MTYKCNLQTCLCNCLPRADLLGNMLQGIRLRRKTPPMHVGVHVSRRFNGIMFKWCYGVLDCADKHRRTVSELVTDESTDTVVKAELVSDDSNDDVKPEPH